MCDHCHFPTRLGTRRRFLRQIAGGAAAAVAWPAVLRGATAQPSVASHGWARLVTPNRKWNFHFKDQDRFTQFLQDQHDLSGGPFGDEVEPGRIEDLCAYPVLFTNNLTSVEDRAHLSNLREYLYRGGFIYVEECLFVSPDFKLFQHDHLAFFRRLLPGRPIYLLKPQHPLYSAYFKVDAGKLWNDGQYPPNEVNPIFGVYDDERILAVISLAHLFCGWGQWPTAVPLKLRLIANIYAYALNPD